MSMECRGTVPDMKKLVAMITLRFDDRWDVLPF